MMQVQGDSGLFASRKAGLMSVPRGGGAHISRHDVSAVAATPTPEEISLEIVHVDTGAGEVGTNVRKEVLSSCLRSARAEIIITLTGIPCFSAPLEPLLATLMRPAMCAT